MSKVCTVEKCDRGVKAKGLCSTHYMRLVNKGDVQAHIPIAPRISKKKRKAPAKVAAKPVAKPVDKPAAPVAEVVITSPAPGNGLFAVRWRETTSHYAEVEFGGTWDGEQFLSDAGQKLTWEAVVDEVAIVDYLDSWPYERELKDVVPLGAPEVGVELIRSYGSDPSRSLERIMERLSEAAEVLGMELDWTLDKCLPELPEVES